MLLRLVAVGKLREPYAVQACAEFRKRLGTYYPYEEVEVRAASASQPEAAMRAEAERVGKLLHPYDAVWLLEREGTLLSSREVSERLVRLADDGTRRLTLIVAGTYGAAPALRERADMLWSLSTLTLLHEWARMLVLEQLYRAAKIARNEPYHH